MTFFEKLRLKIQKGKFNPSSTHEEYAFQRGWNAALDWTLAQAQTIEGESYDGTGTQQQRTVEGSR